MARRNNISRTILKMALLLSLLALFAIAADAQMNRDSPSFEARIPRMADSFLTRQPQTVSPATPYLNAYPLRYPTPPDISISADQQNTTCRQVSFIITLTPNSNSASPSGNQAVKVRITDTVFGNQQAVAEVILFVPGAGGSTSATIGYPLPEDAFAVLAGPMMLWLWQIQITRLRKATRAIIAQPSPASVTEALRCLVWVNDFTTEAQRHREKL
jgi:hypothetical protein